ncbi:hypothetical protein EPN15_01140 [Patescibacteria group bacterium]|nr:MAG: hypothetical protein EPN15_01140 [Patescibacteria group bacterium]
MDKEDGASQKEKEFKIKDDPLVAEKPVKTEDKDVSPEAKKKAVKVILETLDLDPAVADLENFQELLKKAVESLPRYKELEEKLENVSPENLSYELFKTIQRSADIHLTEERKEYLPKDGVLIKSIKQGSPLMCAGRILISSTFLQNRGIEHNVVSTFEGDENDVTGHSVMLLNIDKDVLAYFDPANDLYFTFPKTALRGYEGLAKTSDCYLEEYAGTAGNNIDGINSINRRFISMPADKGIGRQYLNNVSAALGGNKEFASSDIERDSEAKDAVDRLKNDFVGHDPILEKFHEQAEDLIKQFKEKQVLKKLAVLRILNENLDNKDGFILSLAENFTTNNDLTETYPYLKNAPENIRRQAAEKIWDHLKTNIKDD